jgi:hypothetical protein
MVVGPFTTVDAAGTVPNRTPHPLTKLVPVTVTDVPPAVLPPVGLTLLIVGPAAATCTTPFIAVPPGTLCRKQ